MKSTNTYSSRKRNQNYIIWNLENKNKYLRGTLKQSKIASGKKKPSAHKVHLYLTKINKILFIEPYINQYWNCIIVTNKPTSILNKGPFLSRLLKTQNKLNWIYENGSRYEFVSVLSFKVHVDIRIVTIR